MRRRDLHLLKPSQKWLTKAAEATAAVRRGEKTISQCSEVWADLKAELAKLSYNKCWYCESRQTRSDNAVDHFRPKSKYPWHAFSINNFRFTCTFCNSRRTNPETGVVEGKGDSFPLFEGAQSATREEDIDSEQPVLLDPCVAADIGLLDFRADGSPCPAQPNQPRLARRATESIKFYHLDHPELIEQRRMLALKIEGWIKVGSRLYSDVDTNGDAKIDQAFKAIVEEIARNIDDRASELTAFARRIVKIYRTKPWVERLLDV
jgi:uncharacterized protein (TIGR02646 family)